MRVALRASLDPEPGVSASEIKPFSERERRGPKRNYGGAFLKQTIKTSRTAGYLEKMFRSLNDHYFNSEVEEPIITIQSTPKAYGHVTVSKTWHKNNGEWRHELNIDAGTLDRPIEDVTATLLHEMVHLYHLQNNVKDCSRGGTYHNKRFKLTAEICDLQIDFDPRIGWSITSPTEALVDFIVAQGWQDICMGRMDGYITGKPGRGTSSGTNEPTKTKKPSSTRKYVCPKCKMSVRATREVNLLCGDCMMKLELAE